MSTKPHISLLAALAVAWLIIPVSASAKSIGSGAPVKVYARTIEIDERTGVAWYRGDVSVTDGAFFLKADTVEVQMRDGDIEIFKAFGKPVDIEHHSPETKEVVNAKADRATYHVKSQKLEMFGNVELHQQGSELRCAELHYNLKTGQFFAKGDGAQGRCYMFVRPKKKQDKGTRKK
ncbi:MAG: lipopolysaccharide transport periplasmic protein LptA [Acidiferrobacterales bacterium]